MENKLDQLALKQYSTKYSDLLVEKLFIERQSILGKEIIDEIPSKQVGLFVLFNLFKVWKIEIAKLKSPYFNYDNSEIQLKLEELMNLLSKNISISKEHFYPLLVESVENTLLLIMSPLQYYEDLVESYDGAAPNMDEVKDLQRFIKINSHMRDALLTAWASNLEGEELFDKAFEGLTDPPEDLSTLVLPFSELLELEINSFWLDDETEQPADLIEDEKEGIEFETIHTQFSDNEPTLLADTLGFETSQSTLKTMLTINQKFMFVNDLFEGNTDDFNKVIDFLDTCETKEVILKFLHTNYIHRGNWKIEAPQVKEFLSLIDKKFA
jgi:hypothetical protein